MSKTTTGIVVVGLVVVAALFGYLTTSRSSSTLSNGSEAKSSAQVVSVTPNDGRILINGAWYSTNTYILSDRTNLDATCSLTVGQTIVYEWSAQNGYTISSPSNCTVAGWLS